MDFNYWSQNVLTRSCDNVETHYLGRSVSDITAQTSISCQTCSPTLALGSERRWLMGTFSGVRCTPNHLFLDRVETTKEKKKKIVLCFSGKWWKIVMDFCLLIFYKLQNSVLRDGQGLPSGRSKRKYSAAVSRRIPLRSDICWQQRETKCKWTCLHHLVAARFIVISDYQRMFDFLTWWINVWASRLWVWPMIQWKGKCSGALTEKSWKRRLKLTLYPKNFCTTVSFRWYSAINFWIISNTLFYQL